MTAYVDVPLSSLSRLRNFVLGDNDLSLPQFRPDGNDGKNR